MKKLVVLHNKISLAYFETKCIKSFSYNTGGSQFLITLMILKVSGLLGRTKISAPNKLFSPFQHFVKRIKTFSSLWMRILLPQILCINESENFYMKNIWGRALLLISICDINQFIIVLYDNERFQLHSEFKLLYFLYTKMHKLYTSITTSMQVYWLVAIGQQGPNVLITTLTFVLSYRKRIEFVMCKNEQWNRAQVYTTFPTKVSSKNLEKGNR